MPALDEEFAQSLNTDSVTGAKWPVLLRTWVAQKAQMVREVKIEQAIGSTPSTVKSRSQ